MLITCYNFIAVVIAIVIKSFAASAINVFAESVIAVPRYDNLKHI